MLMPRKELFVLEDSAAYALGELIGKPPTLVLLGGGWQSPPPPLAAKHLSVHATLLKNSLSALFARPPPASAAVHGS